MSGVRAAVGDRDADQDVIDIRLRVVDLNVEVPIVIEDASVDQLDLPAATARLTISAEQLLVRVWPLRILVEHPHERMGGGAVQIPVELLAILAVVALLSREAEEALLEDGVHPVPESDRETEDLMAVRDSGDAILVPPVRAAAGVIVRKVIPGSPTGAVVLPHRSPGPLAQIRPPALPVLLPLPGLFEPAFLCTRGRGTELGDGGAHGDSSWRTWPSGSRTRSGRRAEDNAGRPGRVTKLAC